MHHLPGSAAKGAARPPPFCLVCHGYESAAKAESFYVRDVGGPLVRRRVCWVKTGRGSGVSRSLRR